MNKIKNIFYFSLIIFLTFTPTKIFSACTTDCCTNCDNVAYYCNLGCGNVQGCKVGCSFNLLLCQSNCSTNYYIRNASIAKLNFFTSGGTKLDTLDPLDIRTFYPKASDFPITVTPCEAPNAAGCDQKYVIPEKGCYFAWIDHSSPFFCFTSQKKQPMTSFPRKDNVKPMPLPASKNKIVSPHSASPTSSSPSVRKETPEQERHGK